MIGSKISRGGAIDILKNAYVAMNDPRDGGVIKMFFTCLPKASIS